MTTDSSVAYKVSDIEYELKSVLQKSMDVLLDFVSKYDLKTINRLIKKNIINTSVQKKICTLINVHTYYGVKIEESEILSLTDTTLNKLNSAKVKQNQELFNLGISLLKGLIDEDDFIEAIKLENEPIREEAKLLNMLKKVVDKSSTIKLSGNDLDEFNHLVEALKNE